MDHNGRVLNDNWASLEVDKGLNSLKDMKRLRGECLKKLQLEG